MYRRRPDDLWADLVGELETKGGRILPLFRVKNRRTRTPLPVHCRKVRNFLNTSPDDRLARFRIINWRFR